MDDDLTRALVTLIASACGFLLLMGLVGSGRDALRDLIDRRTSKRVDPARLAPIVVFSAYLDDDTITLTLQNIGLTAAHHASVDTAPRLPRLPARGEERALYANLSAELAPQESVVCRLAVTEELRRFDGGLRHLAVRVSHGYHDARTETTHLVSFEHRRAQVDGIPKGYQPEPAW